MLDLQTRICTLIAILNDDISKKAKAAAQQLLTLYEKQAIELINIHLNANNVPWHDLAATIEDYQFGSDMYSIHKVVCKTKGGAELTVSWDTIESD